MISIFLNKIQQLCRGFDASDELSDSPVEDTIHTDEIAPDLTDNLASSCTIVTFYMREDGEFAVTTELKRNNEEAIDMTSTALHMMNSGLLAEYFLKSLNLWADENPTYNSAVSSIIKKWKILFDEDTIDDDNSQGRLAIDPSDVFSLKSFSREDFK